MTDNADSVYITAEGLGGVEDSYGPFDWVEAHPNEITGWAGKKGAKDVTFTADWVEDPDQPGWKVTTNPGTDNALTIATIYDDLTIWSDRVRP